MARSAPLTLLTLALACAADEPSLIFDFGTVPDFGGPVDAGTGPRDGAAPDAGLPMDLGPGGMGPFDMPPAPCPEGDTPLGPVLLAPMPGDALSGPWVTSASLVASCQVVGADSVVIRRLVPVDAVRPREPTVTRDADVYAATFDLSREPNGFLAFECFAEGRTPAGQPTCGFARVETWLDLGPELTLREPAEEAFVRDSLPVRFEVRPAPLAAGDVDALPVSTVLTVAGAEIPTMTNVREDGVIEHQALVDLTDETRFPDGLDGPFELSVRTTNERAVERRETRIFNVDNDGPVIAFESPADGELVGGLVRVRVRLIDPGGADMTSARLRVAGDGERTFSPVSGVEGLLEATFDATDFDASNPSLTLNVTAADTSGNVSTASRTVRLDSAAPLASLDPVDVRVVRRSGPRVLCSSLFDPLGPDSVDDGEVVATQAEFRARVQDRGNATEGDGVVTFLSGVAEVQLFLLDGGELLVDRDGDGVCDDVNPAVRPESGAAEPATVLTLTPVRPTGTPRVFGGDFSSPGEPASAYADGAVYADCEAINGSATARLLCEESSPLSTVIPATYDARAETIYALGPIEGVNCVGSAVNLAPLVTPGRFACAALRSEDALGNASVSPPLRFCVDDGAAGCGATLGARVEAGELPSCTDGCVPPASFRDVPSLQRIDP
ncbi:MAG: hypothetical protein AAGH15_06445 [Myxococcota bacterium]